MRVNECSHVTRWMLSLSARTGTYHASLPSLPTPPWQVMHMVRDLLTEVFDAFAARLDRPGLTYVPLPQDFRSQFFRSEIHSVSTLTAFCSYVCTPACLPRWAAMATCMPPH